MGFAGFPKYWCPLHRNYKSRNWSCFCV